MGTTGSSNMPPSFTDTELISFCGREAWVPDRKRSECTSCSTPFTLRTRRSHCRCCGEVFCRDCCQKVLVPVATTNPELQPMSRAEMTYSLLKVARLEKHRICSSCQMRNENSPASDAHPAGDGISTVACAGAGGGYGQNVHYVVVNDGHRGHCHHHHHRQQRVVYVQG